jgi:hypothetical protein
VEGHQAAESTRPNMWLMRLLTARTSGPLSVVKDGDGRVLTESEALGYIADY